MSDKKVWSRRIHPAYFLDHNIRKHIVIDINYSEDGRLSMTGDSIYGCGQISYLVIDPEAGPKKGFTKDDLQKLYEVWECWHLNDMRAGTPSQEEAVRSWLTQGNSYDYSKACKYLESIGLLYDGDYKYGTKWLFEEVPQDVLKWLFELPGQGDTYQDIIGIPDVSEDELEGLLFK